MKLYPVCVLTALLLAVVGAIWGTAPTTAQTTTAQSSARLAMPEAVAATVGMSVTVPIAFQHGGNAIGSTTFSIDFDQSCLTFDPRTGVQFKIPPAFRGSFSYDATDGNGEVDITIADYSLPTATLPDADPLVTVRFTPICAPTPGTAIIAPVRFSSEIVASFGDVNGLDVAGTTTDGSVAIHLPGDATPTPTMTATATSTPAPGTPSATPTPTPGPGTPSATPTPTSPTLPTSTATVTATPGLGTPSATPTDATPTITPVAGTPRATATDGTPPPTPPYRYYAPLLRYTAP